MYTCTVNPGTSLASVPEKDKKKMANDFLFVFSINNESEHQGMFSSNCLFCYVSEGMQLLGQPSDNRTIR